MNNKNEDNLTPEVDEFLEGINLENIDDKLYLSYLFECEIYNPFGNFSIDQIFAMDVNESRITVEQLNSLENWENAELESYVKKQKETLTRHQAMRIYEVCTGICVCMGMHNREIDSLVKDEIEELGHINNLTKEFESSDLISHFMDLRTIRDSLRDLETKDFETLKKEFGEEVIKEKSKDKAIEKEVSEENIDEIEQKDFGAVMDELIEKELVLEKTI